MKNAMPSDSHPIHRAGEHDLAPRGGRTIVEVVEIDASRDHPNAVDAILLAKELFVARRDGNDSVEAGQRLFLESPHLSELVSHNSRRRPRATDACRAKISDSTLCVKRTLGVSTRAVRQLGGVREVNDQDAGSSSRTAASIVCLPLVERSLATDTGTLDSKRIARRAAWPEDLGVAQEMNRSQIRARLPL